MVYTRNQKRKLNEESDLDNNSDSSDSTYSPEYNTDLMNEFIRFIMDNFNKYQSQNIKQGDNKIKKIKNTQSQLINMLESIYDGTFFIREPLENNEHFINTLEKHQLNFYKNQLDVIRKKYIESSPSIINILNMNISIEQKQKLLEKIYLLNNSDILSNEYNQNIKFLNNNISNNLDPELYKLEQHILQSTLIKSESYKNRILKSNMSLNNKIIAYQKLEIMLTYEDTDSSEYAKYKSWLDLLLAVPFNNFNTLNISINSPLTDIYTFTKNVRNILDEELSFLENPKDQIITLVSEMVRNPKTTINAIGLCGCPGVGKSALVKSISKALNRPYQMISLGGESDVSSLTGHGFTYIGAKPGRLIELLIHSKTMNPIILLDELDKVSNTQHGNEIIGTLIHLTDATTNNKYNHDKYFSGIEFDLSKILFIFTYNDHNKIDKILGDRLIQININNYSLNEKLEITTKHLLPYILSKFNFTKEDLIFDQNTIKYIIQNSNTETGMRDIKIRLKIIISRINNLLLTNQSDNIIKLKYNKLYSYYSSLPKIVLKEHIDILLDDSINNNNQKYHHMYI